MSGFSKEFISQLQQQQADAYNSFYLQTVDMFSRFLISRWQLTQADREDIISNFYVKMWRALPKYNAEYAFETYMWTIFRNTVKDFFKQSKTQFVDMSEEVSSPIDDTENMLDILEMDFEFQQIQEAMQALDQASYEVIFLKYIEQRDYTDIADMLLVSEPAVRKRLSRALKRLKILLNS